MTPVLHYPLLEPHNARGIPPSEASCRTSRGRRAFEHTTTPYRAPHSFWRRRPHRRPFHTQPLVFSTIQRGGLRFRLHNTSSRGLTAVRRGNCIIRDLTRRRHAASQLLMLQNPHTRRHGRRRVADKTRVQRRVARKNSPSTRHMPPVPVQNSPCSPKMALFGAFCSCWESFVPLLSPTSRAGRVFSRTSRGTITGTKETTPQHNAPSRAVKHLPPQHHTQTRAMKHFPPQHATNNPKSPIFTMQGRTFFQPPASRPSQPTVACNSNSAEPHTNVESAEFQRSSLTP